MQGVLSLRPQFLSLKRIVQVACEILSSVLAYQGVMSSDRSDQGVWLKKQNVGAHISSRCRGSGTGEGDRNIIDY